MEGWKEVTIFLINWKIKKNYLQYLISKFRSVILLIYLKKKEEISKFLLLLRFHFPKRCLIPILVWVKVSNYILHVDSCKNLNHQDIREYEYIDSDIRSKFKYRKWYTRRATSTWKSINFPYLCQSLVLNLNCVHNPP